ncbi:hypothetical protein GRJ2_000839800 [Grus japonensis]|uniref:Uncharacterized protein n=1 Tax=Grus japonensis TaxID=30415 RepID=A0ABC9WE15_GRUJA
MMATRRHEQRVSGIKALKNLFVYIELYREGRPVCDTTGDRAVFYSLCKIVTWVEDGGKWQLLEMNKVLDVAF